MVTVIGGGGQPRSFISQLVAARISDHQPWHWYSTSHPGWFMMGSWINCVTILVKLGSFWSPIIIQQETLVFQKLLKYLVRRCLDALGVFSLHAGINWYFYLHLPWKPSSHVGEFIHVPGILCAFLCTAKATNQLVMFRKIIQTTNAP